MLNEPPVIDCPRYYYLPPRDRRALLILVCVLIFSPAIAIAVWTWLLGAPTDDCTGLIVFIGVSSAVLLSLVRAQIRVDADGVARRGFAGWRVTPWSEILDRPAPTLCVGQGPWTGASRRIRRLYSAWWLAPDELLSLQRLLTPPGTRTHLPAVPRRFQMTLFGESMLELDAEGLRFDGHSGVQTWTWDDVRKVTVRKERATTPAMESICIELTGGREFSHKNSTIKCDCPCHCRHDYLLQLFLRSVLQPEQLLIWAKRGEPTSVAEARFRCDAMESELRTGRMFARGYPIIVAGLFCVGLATGNDLSLKLAIQLTGYGVFIVPLLWAVLRKQRKDRDILRAWLAASSESRP